MDQMADEMTLRADVKDKERVNTGEESTAWVRGEKIQTETRVNDRRLSTTTETEPGEIDKDTDAQQPRQCDRSSSPLFSLKMYLRRSSSTESSTKNTLSSSQQSNMGVGALALWTVYMDADFCREVRRDPRGGGSDKIYILDTVVDIFDCAGIVLHCLFCRFFDMLPDSCERATNHCCPNYKQVITTVESTPSSDDDSWIDLDCGLFTSCHDANDCLELAMEVSELCYH